MSVPIKPVLLLSSLLLMLGGCSDRNVPERTAEASESKRETALASPERSLESKPESKVSIAQEVEPDFLGIREVDGQGKTVRKWASDRWNMVQPVTVADRGSSERTALLAYDGQQAQLLEQDGTIETLPRPEWPDEEAVFGTDYGELLMTDRIVDGEAYAIRGGQNLYRINAQTGEVKFVMRSDSPIYGAAASPSGERIALLVSSNGKLETFADLIVLDGEGREMYRQQEAANVPHSDGFFYAYPVEWTDEHTLLVPRGGFGDMPPGAKCEIDLNTGRETMTLPDSLPDEAFALLRSADGEIGKNDLTGVLAQPGQTPSVYAVAEWHGGVKGVWLLDIDSGKTVKLGPGDPLKWTDEGTLLIARNNEEAGIGFVYLGMDK
ncbi:hypothetical protein QWJ34_11435 [Saccharibacillus sp. CPCC 101409]|uniref:hypothetical protein n=1 Tax=Saccharibacillus sp. CPCC 101409 TaxID=3058041 RepID=UPI00267334D1|nr:hypothetical protein [Saccharibacillus sp. CPCC 101409]MDO3410376.1 hypothetical protein [Saccharibacillus sp. CPCC 101409]